MFDDNHPDQYYVTKQSNDSVVLSMLYLDALQVAAPGPQRATYCRCFYCKGRSNCQFINTLEGYSACGQVDEPTGGG